MVILICTPVIMVGVFIAISGMRLVIEDGVFDRLVKLFVKNSTDTLAEQTRIHIPLNSRPIRPPRPNVKASVKPIPSAFKISL